MSGAQILSVVLRALGTLIVFALLGPIVIVLLAIVAAAAFGGPILQLFGDVLNISISQDVLLVALFVLAGFVVIASVGPMVLTGLIFTIAAFAFARNSIWIAWLAMAIGFFVYFAVGAVHDNSTTAASNVALLQQGLQLARAFVLPAIIATSLCWLASRPLHRVGSKA